MKKNATQGPASDPNSRPRTLAVDIGGTGIKTIILDPDGKPLTERERIPTPPRATPKKVMVIIERMARQQGEYDRVSVGFPGVVKNGKLLTAFNLGPGWAKFDFQKALSKHLMRPVRVANDADVQGMGSVSGKGIELLITLGTGLGSALFVDGHVVHMEMGHHPFRKGRTYEQDLGNAALKRKGSKKWNRHVGEAIETLRALFYYDRLYIGGGNAKHIKGNLPPNTQIVSNLEGLLGGVMLWREGELREE
jgi:polyphosphate glucokinase